MYAAGWQSIPWEIFHTKPICWEFQSDSAPKEFHLGKSSCTKSSGIPFSVLFARSGVAEERGKRDVLRFSKFDFCSRIGNIFQCKSCLKYAFGFQLGRKRNVFLRYFAGFDVWTAFEISWLIFAGGRLSQIIMSDRSKAGIEFCTQRELKGADNQVQKYANGIMPFYTENLLMNDIQNIYMKNGKKCKKYKKKYILHKRDRKIYLVTFRRILLILFIVRHSWELIITFPVCCWWQDAGNLPENWNWTSSFRLAKVPKLDTLLDFFLQ